MRAVPGALMKPQVRKTVTDRAGGACELCFRPDANNVHHRRPRGMGGSKLGWIDEPENLLFLCGSGTTGCHGFIESRRAASYQLGWLLRVGFVPAHVPYCDLTGQWWLLTEDSKMPLEFGFDAPTPPRITTTPGAVRLG